MSSPAAMRSSPRRAAPANQLPAIVPAPMMPVAVVSIRKMLMRVGNGLMAVLVLMPCAGWHGLGMPMLVVLIVCMPVFVRD